MDVFLENHKLPKLEQEEIENPNRPITREEIEAVIKNLPGHKSPGPDSFPGEFYQMFKETVPIILMVFRKIEMEYFQTQRPPPKGRIIEQYIPDEHGCQSFHQDTSQKDPTIH